jgi:N-acetyl-D-muramate 6-phosphate phosphatase
MPLDITRVRALIFDIDGTLSDTDDQFVHTLVKWLNPWRFLFQRRNPRLFARWLVMATETPGTFLFGLPDRLGIDDELARLGDLIYRLGLGKSENPFLIIKGIKEMLICLQPHFPMVVVSARSQRSAMFFLDQFELAPFFQHIITAQTCRYTKPYPDPILWAARQMGVLPANCLVVGDTTVDIQAGKAAGAQTVGVLCGFGEEYELLRAGADLILPTTSHLVRCLISEQEIAL